MNTRVWKFAKAVVRLVIEEAASALVRWASRRQSRNRRPWQDPRQ